MYLCNHFRSAGNHDLAATEDARQIGSALFFLFHSRRQLFANAPIAASRVSAYPRAALARRTFRPGISRPIRRPWKRIRSAKATAAQDRLIALVERGIAAVLADATPCSSIARTPAVAGPRCLAPLRARPALSVSVGEQQSHYCDTEQNKTDRAHAVLPSISFPPPASCECRHCSFACRLVTVSWAAILIVADTVWCDCRHGVLVYLRVVVAPRAKVEAASVGGLVIFNACGITHWAGFSFGWVSIWRSQGRARYHPSFT